MKKYFLKFGLHDYVEPFTVDHCPENDGIDVMEIFARYAKMRKLCGASAVIKRDEFERFLWAEFGLETVRLPPKITQRTIVCLCGSTRFMEVFNRANQIETIRGKIVLSVGCDTKSEQYRLMDDAKGVGTKIALDQLHLDKIELADEVLILNVGGYIGESTRKEIERAKMLGKRLRWWEQSKAAEEQS